ncbi:hypothetical protein SpCBS45565_g02717 [Spizellomyces sp. 'palustris']|nr:hypothetical protein SpCBS45565_g02717 [Spizellomyces sp. 'palustris']
MSEPLSPTSPTSTTSTTFSTSPDQPAIPLDVGDVAGVHGRIRFKHETGGQARDAAWLDKERAQLQAYEYLCHIGEAKEWIEACIKFQIASIGELEEELRNGIVLAHLAKSFSPEAVKKIFEDRTRLQFRHSDNINYLFEAMRNVGLPDVFFFELTDLYDKKNIPKVIYCIHALSHLLSKRGLAPSMKNLVGQLTFTDEQLDATQQSLQEAGVSMPAFKNVGDALSKELAEPIPEPVLSEEQKRQIYLAEHVDKVVRLQAEFRAHIARKNYQRLLADYRAHQAKLAEKKEKEYLANIIRAQALVRMHLQRKKYLEKRRTYADNENSIARLQAVWRGRKMREAYKNKLAEIHGKERVWTKIQAKYKGRKQRRRYLERANYLKAQGDSVAKIQSMWRAKRFAKAYHALARLDDPNVNVLRNFLDLLDDTDNDFEEDTEVDRLRQLVVKRIRENITLEGELADLDTKISLLVRNRISLEEVIHFTSKKMRQALNVTKSQEKDLQAAVNLRGKDKESRSKREHYEELFYLLQTQPQYLARLVFTMNKMSGNTATKFLTKVVLSLYGYAQDRRVESLLLSLFREAIKLEVEDITSLEEFWRADPFFIKLVVDYTRRGGNADYLRNLAQPFVKSILSNQDLNLETDPLAIYRTLIAAEEIQTGKKSQRPYDVTSKQAAEDPEVQRIQVQHIAKLKQITGEFVTALSRSTKDMPFGLRYIARQLKEALQKRFPGNDDEIVRLVGGNFIYYRYISPAIIQPEQFEVIDMSVASALSPTQRKNLAEIAKTLHQMSVGKGFSNDDPNLVELNPYISEMFKTFMSVIKEATTVDAELEDEYAEAMSEYASMAQKQRPTVKLSSGEIFQLHKTLVENLDDVADDPKDNLRLVLADLSPVPAVNDDSGPEIELRLRNRFPTLEDERDARVRLLWNEAKRYIMAVIRVQTGKNLLDILEAPVTEKEESIFQEYLALEAQQLDAKKEFQSRQLNQSRDTLNASGSVTGSSQGLAGSVNNLAGLRNSVGSRGLYASQSSLLKSEGGSSTFFSLKRRALENMAKLEAEGQVTKSNQYQDMLNSIAKDMLTKSRRRSRRRKELLSLRNTLKNLEEKAVYLEDQKKSYHDYISACMSQLGNKKHKGKRPLPFTRQYAHQRALAKSGKVPKFGSFKYTAAELHRKGVLISLDDVSPGKYGQITLTISSDEAGIFNIEAAFFGVKMQDKMELRLEDLLAAQYNNETVITLMEGAKINLNLLIFLLNKK